MHKILIAEDRPYLMDELKSAASYSDREIITVDNLDDAINSIQQHNFDVVVTDLRLDKDNEGLEVLRIAKEKDLGTQVIVLTAWGSSKISVQAMRQGAFDYLDRNSPGVDIPSMLRSKINLALEFKKARQRAEHSHE